LRNIDGGVMSREGPTWMPEEPQSARIKRRDSVIMGQFHCLIEEQFTEPMGWKIPLLMKQPCIDSLQRQESTKDSFVNKEDIVRDPSHANEIIKVGVGGREQQGIEQLKGKEAMRIVSPSKMRENYRSKRDVIGEPTVARQESKLPRTDCQESVTEGVFK
jgi:hypothetical protein